MLPEINKETAIALIEDGSGYWAPQCHTPWTGTSDVVVVYIQDKFYAMPREEFNVKVQKVLHFERSSFIMAHAITSTNDELTAIIKEEMARIAQQTSKEPWAQNFLKAAKDIGVPTVVTPKQNRRWSNQFIIVPVDLNAP